MGNTPVVKTQVKPEIKTVLVNGKKATVKTNSDSILRNLVKALKGDNKLYLTNDKLYLDEVNFYYSSLWLRLTAFSKPLNDIISDNKDIKVIIDFDKKTYEITSYTYHQSKDLYKVEIYGELSNNVNKILKELASVISEYVKVYGG